MHACAIVRETARDVPHDGEAEGEEELVEEGGDELQARERRDAGDDGEEAPDRVLLAQVVHKTPAAEHTNGLSSSGARQMQ